MEIGCRHSSGYTRTSRRAGSSFCVRSGTEGGGVAAVHPSCWRRRESILPPSPVSWPVLLLNRNGEDAGREWSRWVKRLATRIRLGKRRCRSASPANRGVKWRGVERRRRGTHTMAHVSASQSIDHQRRRGSAERNTTGGRGGGGGGGGGGGRGVPVGIGTNPNARNRRSSSKYTAHSNRAMGGGATVSAEEKREKMRGCAVLFAVVWCGVVCVLLWCAVV